MKCEVCGDPAKYPKTRLCHACYQGIYYWMRKSPARVILRRQRLQVFQARLDTLVPKNVKILRRG